MTDDTSKRNTNADNQPTPWVILVGLCVLFVLIVIIGIWVFLTYRGIEEKDHEFFRTVALSGTGLMTVFLLIWRSWSAHTQAQNTTRAIENTNRQLEIMTASNAQTLFEKGSNMLGHEKIMVRIGGIKILKELAVIDKIYTVRVMEMFAEFIRTESWPKITNDEKTEEPPKVGKDIQTAFHYITELINKDEHKKNIIINIDNSYLSGLYINGLDLSSESRIILNMNNSFLYGLTIDNSYISGIQLTNCNISNIEIDEYSRIECFAEYSKFKDYKNDSINRIYTPSPSRECLICLGDLVEEYKIKNNDDSWSFFWENYIENQYSAEGQKELKKINTKKIPTWPPAKNP